MLSIFSFIIDYFRRKKDNILPNKAPIMVTWVPREPGATLPDGENSELNYVDILIKHKQENNEKRDIILFVNGPGFKPGQIDDLKNKFKRVKGIHVVDLHDPKYDRYWKEIDQGWKINGKPISIKEYYKNMYSMQNENRTHFAIEIDTFRYIAAYCLLREQEELKRDLGVIYTDFDALNAIMNYWPEAYIKKLGKEYRKQEGIGQNITIPFGILADCAGYEGQKACVNNDVFAITDYNILEKICNDYKGNILDQRQMINTELKESSESEYRYMDTLLPPGKDFDSMSVLEIFQRMLNHPAHMNNFLCRMNLGQLSFMSTVTNMIKDKSVWDFDFVENGGEYTEQKEEIESCDRGDQSWLKDIYNKKEGKNEQVSEQPDEPSRLIDEIGTKSPSRNACSVQ